MLGGEQAARVDGEVVPRDGEGRRRILLADLHDGVGPLHQDDLDGDGSGADDSEEGLDAVHLGMGLGGAAYGAEGDDVSVQLLLEGPSGATA